MNAPYFRMQLNCHHPSYLLYLIQIVFTNVEGAMVTMKDAVIAIQDQGLGQLVAHVTRLGIAMTYLQGASQ